MIENWTRSVIYPNEKSEPSDNIPAIVNLSSQKAGEISDWRATIAGRRNDWLN